MGGLEQKGGRGCKDLLVRLAKNRTSQNRKKTQLDCFDSSSPIGSWLRVNLALSGPLLMVPYEADGSGLASLQMPDETQQAQAVLKSL